MNKASIPFSTVKVGRPKGYFWNHVINSEIIYSEIKLYIGCCGHITEKTDINNEDFSVNPLEFKNEGKIHQKKKWTNTQILGVEKTYCLSKRDYKKTSYLNTSDEISEL